MWGCHCAAWAVASYGFVHVGEVTTTGGECFLSGVVGESIRMGSPREAGCGSESESSGLVSSRSCGCYWVGGEWLAEGPGESVDSGDEVGPVCRSLDCRQARLALLRRVSRRRAVAIRFRISVLFRAGSRAALCMCGMVGGATGLGAGKDIAGGVGQRAGCRGVGLPIWAEVPCGGVASVCVGGVEVE